MKFAVLVRRAAAAVALLLALPLASSPAAAQAWPGRQPIRFVIPYPPGGASDVTARALGAKLSEAVGQSVIIENRPGANGIVALEHFAHQPGDGYTLLMANLGPNAINPAVYQKLPYDAFKDFVPVMLTTLVPLFLVVNPAMPVNNVPELIALAKAQPGKINFGSAGNGASNHLAGELFNSMAGIKLVHVPYKGDTPAMTDVMAGTVSVMFPTAIAATPHVKSGKLKALAVTSSKRVPSVPDLPTVSETLPGFEAVSWGGIMATRGTPPEIVTRLHTEFAKIMKMPDIVEKLSSLGAEIVAGTPDEFAAYLKSEIAKWSKVARDSNVRLD
jgi:tripartite-type tricarboxylate transporter receptor subunit TctC